jgi:hypothetical protein
LLSSDVRYLNTQGHFAFLDTDTGQPVGNAVYLKAFFTSEECADFTDHITRDDKMWQYREDHNRGPKDFLITGVWTAQGQVSYGKGKSYAAGVAGKLVASDPALKSFNDPMADWGCRLFALLERFRPDVVSLLSQLPPEEKPIGGFPLFMATRGIALMHRDRNDYLSILVLLKTTLNCGGGLEIGGSDTCINWDIGDLIILDSAKLMHGTQVYYGDLNERIVGIWIVHKSMLRMHKLIE